MKPYYIYLNECGYRRKIENKNIKDFIKKYAFRYPKYEMLFYLLSVDPVLYYKKLDDSKEVKYFYFNVHISYGGTISLVFNSVSVLYSYTTMNKNLIRSVKYKTIFRDDVYIMGQGSFGYKLPLSEIHKHRRDDKLEDLLNGI